MASRVNKTVHRMWRRSTFDLLTGYKGHFHMLLTHLLTAASESEMSLKSAAQQKLVRDNMADVWNASRLGFAGVARLTLPGASRPMRLLLATAFVTGQRLRLATKAYYAGIEAPKAPVARDHAPRALTNAHAKAILGGL